MSRDDRHHSLAELGGYLHLRPLAPDRQRHFIALFLGADKCLKLLGIHDALVAEHDDHVILLYAGFLGRAAVHDVSDEKAKAFRHIHLRGQLWGETTGEQAQIGHGLCFWCLRAFAMFATLVVIVSGARALAFVVSVALAIAVRLFITIRPGSGGGFGGFDRLLWRPAFLCR